MENTIYRIHDTDLVSAENRHRLEFYCCHTNELNPYKKIRELGVVVSDEKGLQIDFSFEQGELKSLIAYLSLLSDHIEEFNSNSKPEEKC